MSWGNESVIIQWLKVQPTKHSDRYKIKLLIFQSIYSAADEKQAAAAGSSIEQMQCCCARPTHINQSD